MGFLYDEWKVRNSTTSSEKQVANVEFVLKNLDNLIPVVAKIIFPVDSIYMSVSDSNPANWISGTAWVLWGSGRVPVGVNSSEAEFNIAEKTGGSKEIPYHKHTLSGLSGNVNSAGSHAHTISDPGHSHIQNNRGTGDHKNPAGDDGDYLSKATPSHRTSTEGTGISINSGGNHTHGLSDLRGTVDYASNNASVNNLQPYITCYMWKRIA